MAVIILAIPALSNGIPEDSVGNESIPREAREKEREFLFIDSELHLGIHTFT